VSTSRIENGNRDEQFAWKRRAEAVGTRNGKAAESDRGTPIAERQRVLAGEGPHAGGRPAVHQNRSQRSLQRGGAVAVDAGASAPFNQRTVTESTIRIKVNHYTRTDTYEHVQERRLECFTHEPDFYLLVTLS
jgi:hypothetical protein